ncbi:MAG TPA: Npt1/Npt2 family nucleotide transporter [Myxococcota bacterium]|nr:Npt1/Npt2 family nucleotide transporter [Myxococcota bacterium]
MRERRRAGLFAAAMAAIFFAIVTLFWVLKPLKKGLFLRTYDATGFDLLGVLLTSAQAELIAKIGNLAVALAAAAIFTALARRLRPHRLALVIGAAFLAGHALFARLVAAPGGATVWAFYLYGDLWSTAMIAAFFAFLNDTVSPAEARRLYGPIGVGGVLGGVVGSTMVAAWLERLDLPTWLWICVAGTLAILALFAAIGRFAAPGGAPARKEEGEGPAALAAVRRVARSRYLLALVAMVALYEMTSTLLDFQFSGTLVRHLDGAAIDAHLARVFAITNGTALAVQLVVTPLLLTRVGVGPALLVLPTAALAAEACFALAPRLWTASALSVADNSLNYSVQQSSREALYVPLDRAEKLDAKAVIDVFVQRLAKVLAIGVSLALTLWWSGPSALRWLALPTAVVLALWILCARYADREYRRLTEKEPA